MPLEDDPNYDGRFSAAYDEALRQVVSMDALPDVRRVYEAVTRMKQGWTAADIGPGINSIYGAKDVGYVLAEVIKSVEYLNEVARCLRDYLEEPPF